MVTATGSFMINPVSPPATMKIASPSGMLAQAPARTSPGTITATVVMAAASVKKSTSSSNIFAVNAATTALAYAGGEVNSRWRLNGVDIRLTPTRASWSAIGE